MVLSEDGDVWTWGYGGKKGFFNWMYTQEVGALGHNSLDPHFNPKKVEFFSKNGIKIDKIAAGNYHCVAVTESGDMYNWGRGLYGVLGNGSN
jgi:alpha-tubulin suppressor-like RCC1 family protein